MLNSFSSKFFQRVLLFLIAAIIPTLIIIFYTFSKHREWIINQIQTYTMNFAEATAVNEEQLIKGTEQLLQTLSQFPIIRRADSSNCSDLFKSLVNQYEQYANLGIATINGDVICTAKKIVNTTVFEESWFQQTIQAKSFTISSYHIDPVTQIPVIVFAYPVLDDQNKSPKILFVEADLSWINPFDSKVISQMLPKTVLTYINDDGIILDRLPESENWIGKNVKQTYIIDQVLKQKQGIVTAPGLDGVKRLHAFVPVHNEMVGEVVYIILSSPAESIFAEANRFLFQNLILLSTAFVLLSVFAWLGGNFLIIRRIDALLLASKKLAEGNLNARVDTKYHKGELKQLAMTFNRMAAALQERDQRQQQIKEDLRENENRMRSIVTNIPVILFVVDKNGVFTFIEGKGLSESRYNPELLIGQSVFELYIDYPERLQIMREALSGNVVNWSGWVNERYFNSYLNPQSDKMGNVQGVIGVAVDTTDQQKAEEALLQNRQRLQAIFDNALDAIIIMNNKARLVEVNKATSLLLGFSREELLNLYLWNIVPSRIVELGHKRWQDLLTEGIQSGEFTMLTKKGEFIDIEYNSVANIVPGLHLTIMRDITPRKAAEKALRESEYYYRLLFNKNPYPMWVYDRDTLSFLTVNDASVQHYGYSKNEFLTMTIRDLIPQEELPRFDELSSTNDDHFSKNTSWLNKKKNGEIVFVEITASDILYQNRLARLALVHDVTQAKLAREDLLETKNLLEKTVASLVEAVFIVDPLERKIITCNSAVKRVFGYEPEEVIGKNSEFLHVDREHFEEFGEKIKSALGKSSMFHGEFEMKRKDGQIITTEHTVTNIADEKGLAAGVVSVVRDITEHKKNIQEIQKSHEQLRALTAHLQSVREQERTNIAREIHDEMGQVLTALKMDLTILIRELSEQNQTINRSFLFDELNSMKDLIDTTIKKIRKLITELRPEVLDSLGIVEAIEWQLAEFESRSEIKSSFHSSEQMIPINKEKSIAIFRIVQEALTNIARHAEATLVEIELIVENNHLLLSIRDNGIGMNKDKTDQPISFGLLGMKERVHTLKGEIKIESEPGKGTNIRVKIPLN